MQNSVLKLTALAGVVGIGFLVVYQAQRGIWDPSPEIDTGAAFEQLAGENPPAVPGSESDSSPPNGNTNLSTSINDLPNQSEPEAVLPVPNESTHGAHEHHSKAQPADTQNEGIDARESQYVENRNPFDADDDSSAMRAADTDSNTYTDSDDEPEAEAATDAVVRVPAERTRKGNSIVQAGYDEETVDVEDLEDSAATQDEPRQGSLKGPQLFSPTPREESASSMLDHQPLKTKTTTSTQSEKQSPSAKDAKPDIRFDLTPRTPSESIADQKPTSYASPDFGHDRPSRPVPSSSEPGADSKPRPLFLNLTGDDDESKDEAGYAPVDLIESANSSESVDSSEATDTKLVSHDVDTSKPGSESASKSKQETTEPTDSEDSDDSQSEPESLFDGNLSESPSKSKNALPSPDPSAFKPIGSEKSSNREGESSTPSEVDTLQPDPGATSKSELKDEEEPLKATSDDDSSQHEPELLRVPPKRSVVENVPPSPAAKSAAQSTPATESARDENIAVSGRPERLKAPADAARIGPLRNDDLRGDGTVGKHSPRGPQQPQLKLEKIAPRVAILGQPLVYTIVVTNIGRSPARRVMVYDHIPKGSQLSGTIPRAELRGKKLSWKLGTVKPGEQRQIAVRIVPITEGNLGSVATVSFAAEVAAQTLITAPKIDISLKAPRQVTLGDTVTLKFKITNKGTTDANKVIVRNIIPSQLSHPAGNDIEYEIGLLPPGTSRELSLTLKAVAVGKIANRAVVTSADGASIETSAALAIVGTKLALARTGPKRQYVGRTASYTNTVTNKSTSSVGTSKVVEHVPEGMEFVKASDGGRYDANTRTISWTISGLSPNESKALKIKLRSRQTGTQSSVVTVSDPSGKRVEISSQTRIEGFASVRLDVLAIEGPIEVGENAVVHIVVRNRGTLPATNVRVRFTIPPETELVSVKGPSRHTQTGKSVQFAPIAGIDAQRNVSIDVVLKAREAGDARFEVQIEADQLRKPLTREEPLVILAPQQ